MKFQVVREGLPGVGPSSAVALLAKFGSAHAVFAADVPDLCAVKDIGLKTAERIVESLRAPVVDLHR
jgi:ERCC4-type nuclease